jgi:hypothetical protein
VIKGFGLIEVMSSAAMLALVMAGAAQAASTLQGAAAHQRYVAQALHIAERQTEDLLVRYATDADLTEGTHTGSGYTSRGVESSAPFFTTSWFVDEGVPLAGTRTLAFTVTWSERGSAKSLTLRTIRT